MYQLNHYSIVIGDITGTYIDKSEYDTVKHYNICNTFFGKDSSITNMDEFSHLYHE